MKKFLLYFLPIALAVDMTSCQDKNKPEEPKPEEVTYKLTINPSELSLYADESATLKLTLTPEAQNVEYRFTTDDEEIATVSAKGHVTAGKKYGEATITVRASIDGEEVARARCYVEVVKDKVILSEEEVKLEEGKSVNLKATSEKTGTDITSAGSWKSSNTSVATVSSTGLVKAVGEGECTITISYNGASAICHVVVIPTLTVTPKEVTLLVGETQQLTSNIKGTAYLSSNPSVAAVDNNGLITAKAAGNALITAAANDMVNVIKVAVSGDLKVLLNGSSISKLELHLGQTVTLTTNTSQKVTWAIYPSTSYVTINNGVVKSNGTKIGSGFYYIKATAGSLSVSIPLTTVGAFQCGSNKYVGFSQANLQYSGGYYSFIYGEYHANSSASYYVEDNYIFYWGSGADPSRKPTSTSASSFVDWGKNSIDGSPANTWRTPTSTEWDYIVNKRPNAKNLKGTARITSGSDKYYGMVLLPDGWVKPSSVNFSSSSTNYYEYYDWNRMRDNGAIFLQYDGYYNSSTGTWTDTNSFGYYWCKDGGSYFKTSGSVTTGSSTTLGYKMSVRLVRDIE